MIDLIYTSAITQMPPYIGGGGTDGTISNYISERDIDPLATMSDYLIIRYQ